MPLKIYPVLEIDLWLSMNIPSSVAAATSSVSRAWSYAFDNLIETTSLRCYRKLSENALLLGHVSRFFLPWAWYCC